MGTTTAQCPAAPKPHQYPPPSMPRPGPGHPSPATMTVAELEAAVAALPGKRDALREAFDRLAACSPSPLPFAWEDLDAHLSSLHWSIALRFRQVRALEAARPAPTAAAAPGETNGDGTGESLEGEEVLEAEETVVEQEEDEMANEEMQEGASGEEGDTIGKDGKDEKEGRGEVMEEEEVGEVADDKIGNEIKDDKDAREEMQVANEEEQSTEDGKKASRDGEDVNMKEEQSTKNAKKASQDKEEEEEEEQSMEDAKKASQDKEDEEQSMEDAKKVYLDKEEDGDMDEAATNKTSAVRGKEQEACNEKEVEEDEQEAHKEEQDAKNTTREEKAKNVSQDQGSGAPPGPVEFDDLAAAVISMDARRLVKLIHSNVGLSSKFHAAMSRAPDGAALSLRIVELFLHDKTLKTNKVWNNCVGLIQTVPGVVTKLSAESIERAKQLAKDWKEMIDNPGSQTALGSLSSWGLLNFLSSYNIVSEFDTKEIFRIFGTIPRKQQRKNHSVLLKGLGLADRIPELMDYLIGNGQQLNVLYLAPFFNLVDKYPPLCLLKGYVEKVKQTVMEISQKSMTRQSLREVIIKELVDLRVAHDLAKQRITDSGLHTGIMAEIHGLLREFGKKKRSLADASTALTSNPQQQKAESSKKRKKEQAQDHHTGHESQQERQQSKPGEKLEQKQKKPQQEQQQKKQNEPQKEQQQKQEDKLQEKQQKRPRRRTPTSPSAWTMMQRGHSGHPPYAAMQGVHHAYPAQPGWPGVQGVHHAYPAQPGWPGVHCAPPFAPQIGAPEYIRPFDPFYHRPEFYPR